MRRWLVLISATLHLALVFGLFVAGFWKLEQLDRPRLSVALAQPLPPPPAPAGGASPTTAPKLTPKTPKRIAKEPTQPEPKPVEAAKPVETTTTGGGEGSGEGSGKGSGDPLSTGDCTLDCGPGDGSGSAAPKKKDDEVKTPPPLVPPDVIRGMRLSGETQVHPPEVEQTAMLRDGKEKVIAVFQTCVNEAGGVGMVKMLKSTGYTGYDQALSQALTGWHYKPYKIGDRAVTVCGIVTFVYQIK